MSEAAAGPAPAKFSLSLGPKKPSTVNTTSSSTIAKRPWTRLESDQDHVDDQEQNHVQISSFDATNKTKVEKQTTRTIEPIPNRDWRAERRRKRQRNGALVNGAKDDTVGGVARLNTQEDTVTTTNGAAAPKILEEEAIASLSGKKTEPTDTTIIAPESPSAIEDEAFRNDFRNAPPAASLDDYEATPIDGFGAALMRGYLKPGQTLESIAASRKAPAAKGERRKDLVGLGAKEMDLGPDSASSKVKERGGKGRVMREAGEYNPLARVNRKTGEVIGEEELKKKIEAQKEVDLQENSSKRDHERRRDRDDGRDRRRDRRVEPDRERATHGDRRRRDDDPERSSKNDRYGDEDEYFYRKDRERNYYRRRYDKEDSRQRGHGSRHNGRENYRH